MFLKLFQAEHPESPGVFSPPYQNLGALVGGPVGTLHLTLHKHSFSPSLSPIKFHSLPLGPLSFPFSLLPCPEETPRSPAQPLQAILDIYTEQFVEASLRSFHISQAGKISARGLLAEGSCNDGAAIPAHPGPTPRPAPRTRHRHTQRVVVG